MPGKSKTPESSNTLRKNSEVDASKPSSANDGTSQKRQPKLKMATKQMSHFFHIPTVKNHQMMGSLMVKRKLIQKQNRNFHL